ncbi:hypothetical protein Ctob_015784 [Chrysochromulina tobinii]|uniref:Uncharacterized protein n=1 Tax=Chrysochromulina tobinii TaxID=1460289 RepID=A0A0M0K7E5_9EUKA|nr:hypothetical protein Ctob_015784 [Chrysochromulina tobinii]|eukprot:KOO34729.1 hypothetical protein Ctob_015784 [Chrysochromulina sp. CCMP291]
MTTARCAFTCTTRRYRSRQSRRPLRWMKSGPRRRPGPTRSHRSRRFTSRAATTLRRRPRRPASSMAMASPMSSSSRPRRRTTRSARRPQTRCHTLSARR